MLVFSLLGSCDHACDRCPSRRLADATRTRAVVSCIVSTWISDNAFLLVHLQHASELDVRSKYTTLT